VEDLSRNAGQLEALARWLTEHGDTLVDPRMSPAGQPPFLPEMIARLVAASKSARELAAEVHMFTSADNGPQALGFERLRLK
jgi:hypothetical protein